jgi:hypothetical protein
MTLQRKHPRPWYSQTDGAVRDANDVLVGYAYSKQYADTFVEEVNGEVLVVAKPSPAAVFNFRFIVDESIPDGVFAMIGSDRKAVWCKP